MTVYQRLSLPAAEPQAPQFGIDLRLLWSIFRRRLGLLIAVMAIVLTVVTIVTFQLTPKYTAEARVVLNLRETQALDVSAIISGMSADAATVETEAELIRSRSIAREVVDALSLTEVAEFNPALDEDEGFLLRLVPSQLRSEETLAPEVVRDRAVDRLIDRIDVERAGITYAILIRVESEDPTRAASIANAFAERYIVDQLDQKFETFELVSRYFDEALEENRLRLRAAENAVEAYRVENGLLSAEGSLLSEQQISDLQAELIVQEADLSESRAKLTNVRRRLDVGAGVEAIADVLASPVIATLRSKEADLARRRADLETRYGPLHPSIDNLASEEADLQAQIQSEVDRIVSRLESDVEVARGRVTSLRQSIDDLRTGLSTDNQAQVRLRELEREAQVSRRNYEQLLERSQQVTMFENLAEADARIADTAVTPREPSFPNKKLNLALGLVMGAALGGLAVTIAEVFDQGLRTAADVERTLDARTLSLVPLLTRRQLKDDTPTPADYVVEKPLSSFAESYRALRTALTLARKDGEGGQVVALTSAVSGEAKTVSAMCLGRIAALSGDRAVVVDADLRRRSVSLMAMEDVEGAKGLTELLRGDADLDTVLVTDPRTDLHILPQSEDAVGKGDPFGGRAFRDLLATLRQRYDLVLLDTAPLTAVAETRSLVALADTAVQFVKWKGTPVGLARSGRRILADLDTPVVGVVLTQVDLRAQAAYGEEGSYRYYAKHGSYYAD